MGVKGERDVGERRGRRRGRELRKGIGGYWSDRPGRSDGSDRGHRPGRPDGSDRSDRPGRSDGSHRSRRPGRSDGSHRSDWPSRSDRSHRPRRRYGSHR